MTLRNSLKNIYTKLAFPKFLWEKKKIPIRSQRQYALTPLCLHRHPPQESETTSHPIARGELEMWESSILYILGITKEKEQTRGEWKLSVLQRYHRTFPLPILYIIKKKDKCILLPSLSSSDWRKKVILKLTLQFKKSSTGNISFKCVNY